MRKEKIQCTKQDGVVLCVTLQGLFSSAVTSSTFAFYFVFLEAVLFAAMVAISETIPLQDIYISINTFNNFISLQIHIVFSQASFTEKLSFTLFYSKCMYVWMDGWMYLFIYLFDSSK